MKKNRKKLKISELARAAGVSVPTVKHYLKQGLIPRPQKTGRTMAYYDKSGIDRIRFIKKLQREKFLPLEVIKRLIDSGAAYDEELEFGQAIFKPQKFAGRGKLASQREIEKLTGYSLRKIHLLEKEKLLMPVPENGDKYYDAIDQEIIRIFKFREGLGLPLDYSLETMRAYRDAIRAAVQKDMSLFAGSMLGDVSTERAVKLMTEADETLDRFMVLYRRKALRSQSEAALEQVSRFSAGLKQLLVLPLPGRELCEAPPKQMPWRAIHFLIAGNFRAALSETDASAKGPSLLPLKIFTELLAGNAAKALALAESSIPDKSRRKLDHLAAGLTYLSAIARAPGFSRPAQLLKKGIAHFRRIEISPNDNSLVGILAGYACGAVDTILPEIFNTREQGLLLLAQAGASLKRREIRTGAVPRWLAKTIKRELFPAMERKINRFLAEAGARKNGKKAAQKSRNRVLKRSVAKTRAQRGEHG